MSADLSPEQRRTPEAILNSPEMRVYPLGFTPEVKQSLRNLDVDLGRNILGFLTEEEIAVVLAKISRNPGGFLEIAKTVDEEGASKFHAKWVVSVEGYGHASVAEHAIIHMATENISSLAGDELTDNRLAAFTEFSARFKGIQNVTYYTPRVIYESPDLSKKWHETHSKIFALNELLMQKGIAYIQTEKAREKHPERKVEGARGVKTVADQLKNLMPASRLTSVGVTINGREDEHMITKFLSSQYEEVRGIGRKWKEESLKVVPTLVKYADRSNYLVLTREGINFLLKNYEMDKGTYPEIKEEGGKFVKLVDYDPDAEKKFIAAALYRSSPGKTYEQILETVLLMTPKEREWAFEKLLGNLGKHDAPIRMLEFAGDYKIEVPNMTYGDWREWKRHRMETYDAKDLDVAYGYMIPQLAYEMDESEDPQYHGSVDAIKSVMSDIEELFNLIKNFDSLSAHYCVTRFHYRPAIVKMNLREAFHLISLRTGPTAHPFIRRLAWPFYDEVKKVHPLFAEYLGRRIYSEGRPSRDFKWTY